MIMVYINKLCFACGLLLALLCVGIEVRAESIAVAGSQPSRSTSSSDDSDSTDASTAAALVATATQQS